MELGNSVWNYLQLSAPYLLFGLLMAGAVNVFLNIQMVQKHLGKSSFWSVFKASLLGVPLPLCSCSVIPTAVTLKKAGAKNSEVSSFLISTPESGVDSIMVTYGMMDLPMTIIRPIAAFASAFVAGVMQIFWNDEDVPVVEEQKSSCCSKSGCGSKAQEGMLKKIFKFAFVDLLDDLALWLAFGLILGGVMDYFLPVDFFSGLNGPLGRFLMLLIGIPLYVCASASTPIAAAMVAKGMSPGVALIFLLVGPATNVSNLAVLQKYIGKKGIILNIVALSLVSLIFSFVVDAMYIRFGLAMDFKVFEEHEHSSMAMTLMTLLFCLLLLRSVFSVLKKKYLTRE